MAGTTHPNSGWAGNRWRVAGWTLAASLLLLPPVAMRFTDEVAWTGSDFAAAGALVGGVGIGLEIAFRTSRSLAYRAGAAAAIATAFLTVWINLAVGIIGSENNSTNLLFAGVLAVALLGSAAGRFRPAGMARATAATAAAQAVVAVVALTIDVRGAVLSGIFAAAWLLSAALFRRAARERQAG